MNKIGFILSLWAFPLFGQYGVDGAVAAGGHLAMWAMEKKDLDDIMDSQKKIFAVNMASALAEAKLLDISKERYHSLSHVDDGIANAEILAHIITESKKLIEIDKAIAKLVQGYPVVQGLVSPAIRDLILEQGLLLKDILIGKEDTGKKNLMDSRDRYLFISRILRKIKYINEMGSEIYFMAEKLISLQELEKSKVDQYFPPKAYNIQKNIWDTKDLIDKLIKNDSIK